MQERFIRAATIRDTLLLLFYSIVAVAHTVCGNGSAVEDRFNARESESVSGKSFYEMQKENIMGHKKALNAFAEWFIGNIRRIFRALRLDKYVCAILYIWENYAFLSILFRETYMCVCARLCLGVVQFN